MAGLELALQRADMLLLMSVKLGRIIGTVCVDRVYSVLVLSLSILFSTHFADECTKVRRCEELRRSESAALEGFKHVLGRLRY